MWPCAHCGPGPGGRVPGGAPVTPGDHTMQRLHAADEACTHPNRPSLTRPVHHVCSSVASLILSPWAVAGLQCCLHASGDFLVRSRPIIRVHPSPALRHKVTARSHDQSCFSTDSPTGVRQAAIMSSTTVDCSTTSGLPASQVNPSQSGHQSQPKPSCLMRQAQATEAAASP